jgi:hypothetical protein
MSSHRKRTPLLAKELTMRKSLVLIAAASLAAGSFVFLGQQRWLHAGSGTDRTGMKDEATPRAKNLPQGITASATDQTDNEGIRNTLGKTVDYLASNDWSGFTDFLSDADRTRIGDFSKVDHADLDKTLTQFKADWKAKYNQDFNLPDSQAAVFGNDYKGFEIVQGEVSNPALLSNWPVESTGEHKDMRSSVGGADITVIPKTGGVAAARDLIKGTTVAVVYFPSQKNASEVAVSLVRQVPVPKGDEDMVAPLPSDTWKIDIPDSIDAQKLSSNLNKHLSKVDSMKNQWPADVNDAYRFVSQHTLMAMYDTSGTSGSGSKSHDSDSHTDK